MPRGINNYCHNIPKKQRPSTSSRFLFVLIVYLAKLFKGSSSGGGSSSKGKDTRVQSNIMRNDVHKTTDRELENDKNVHYYRCSTYGINRQTSSSSFPLERDEWRAAFDVKSGFVYFYNKRTRETTWEKPDNFKQQWSVFEEEDTGDSTNGINWLTSPSYPSNKDEWRAALDAKSGYVYFYNKRTRETTWEKPVNFTQWQVIEEVGTGGENLLSYNILKRTISRSRPDYSGRRQTMTQTDHNRTGQIKKTTGRVSSSGRKKSKEQQPSTYISTNKIHKDDFVSPYSTLCQGIMPFTSYEKSKSNKLKDFVPFQRNLENVKVNSYHAIKRSEYESFHDRNPPVINIIRNGRLRVQYL